MTKHPFLYLVCLKRIFSSNIVPAIMQLLLLIKTKKLGWVWSGESVRYAALAQHLCMIVITMSTTRIIRELLYDGKTSFVLPYVMLSLSRSLWQMKCCTVPWVLWSVVPLPGYRFNLKWYKKQSTWSDFLFVPLPFPRPTFGRVFRLQHYPGFCIKGFSPTIHDGALLLSLLNLVNQLLGSGSHFLARTRLERWSTFCGDGMVMVIFSQWWNGDGFWKCLTITIDGFWWDQPSATMVFLIFGTNE